MKIINFYEGHIYECLYFLALSPFPGPDPSPGPQLYLPALAPNLYLPVLAPNSHLPALAPHLYLPATAPIYIYWLWPTILLPARA